MEHRPMRRKDRQLSRDEAWTILEQGTHGILAVTGDEGWPYAVPLNYFLLNGRLYFHCAREGHLLDSIAKDSRVCFTVVTRHDLVPNHITTLYESAVVFGHAALVEDEEERLALLGSLVDSLGEVSEDIKIRYIQSKEAKTAVVRITPDHVTAKANHSYIPVEQRM